jgi:arylsulfatase A-like enzyme
MKASLVPLGVLAGVTAFAAPGAARRPNIVVIVTDDLRTDPRELHNLAADPAPAGLRRQLEEKLTRLQAAAGIR